jgi:hypothetical protein
MPSLYIIVLHLKNPAWFDMGDVDVRRGFAGFHRGSGRVIVGSKTSALS